MQATRISVRRGCFAVAIFSTLCASSNCLAAFAKSIGQPISAYSASLFGKRGLTALQTQTLTCDPVAPLFGSTSVEYDVGVVQVMGFGYGPGYVRSSTAPQNAPSGASIEIMFSNEPTMVDLRTYLSGEFGTSAKETGYIQLFYELSTSGQNAGPGKYIPPDSTFIGSNAAIPGGVDTHFFEFQYRPGVPDAIAAYSITSFPARAAPSISWPPAPESSRSSPPPARSSTPSSPARLSPSLPRRP